MECLFIHTKPPRDRPSKRPHGESLQSPVIFDMGQIIGPLFCADRIPSARVYQR
jgi:hypothetical protein